MFDDAVSDTGVVNQGETLTSTVSDEDPSSRVLTPVRSTWERVLPWAMALVFAGLYTTISVTRFEQLRPASFDLGIFEQAIRHYAHFEAPIVDLEGAGHNFLGDHWNPAIVVFAPFYRLFPFPQTLLVGQAVAIALAVVPITRAGMRHLGRWPGIAIGLAFGMSYGIQAAVAFDVHGVALAVPLLAFALEAFLASRWRVAVAWVAPLVLVKEDLGLTVAAFGVVLVLVGARRWGVGLAAFGLGWSALTFAVLLPYFNAGGDKSRISVLAQGSATDGSLAHRIYDLPFDVATSEPKAMTVFLLLAVTAFLSTQSPLMIMVLPTLCWRFLSTNENFWGQTYHYDLVLMPILFAALIDGARRARRDSWAPLRGYARAAPTLVLLVALFLTTRYSFRDLVNPASYQPSPRAQAAERVLSRIPDGATVETDLGLIAKLTHRTRVFWAGNAAPVVPQFALIAHWDEKQPYEPVKWAESLHPGRKYVLDYAESGYTLLRRIN